MKKWMLTIGVLAAVMALTACKSKEVSSDFVPPETTTAAGSSTGERPTMPPVDPMDMAFIFRNNNGEFERVMMDVDEITDEFIMEKLIEYGVLDEGTEILSFEIVQETDGTEATGETEETAGSPVSPIGPGVEGGTPITVTGTLNLSQIPDWSAEEEELMLKCLANTFVDNFQLNRLKLLVNGENYSGAGITLGDDDYLEYKSGYKNVTED